MNLVQDGENSKERDYGDQGSKSTILKSPSKINEDGLGETAYLESGNVIEYQEKRKSIPVN